MSSHILGVRYFLICWQIRWGFTICSHYIDNDWISKRQVLNIVFFSSGCLLTLEYLEYHNIYQNLNITIINFKETFMFYFNDDELKIKK